MVEVIKMTFFVRNDGQKPMHVLLLLPMRNEGLRKTVIFQPKIGRCWLSPPLERGLRGGERRRKVVLAPPSTLPQKQLFPHSLKFPELRLLKLCTSLEVMYVVFIERSEIRKKQNDFKSVHFERRMGLFNRM